MTLSRVNKLISGPRIYLRPLTLADATEAYCAWLNDPEVNKFLETRRATVDELKAYITKQLNNPNSRFMGVFANESDTHIGNVKLEPIDWPKKNAVFGILIGDKNYWGQGIGTEATQLTVDYAFNQLKLNEVELGVIADNQRATRAYEKVGFTVVKVRKNAVNHDGVLYDHLTMVVKKSASR